MKTVTLSDKARQLEERKRALELAGVRVEVPRNDGKHRMPEKRALLQALANEARRQGREPPFEANF